MIYRVNPAYDYVAKNAANWAVTHYYSTNGIFGTQNIFPKYSIFTNLTSTDYVYCSKLVWQAYYYGSGSLPFMDPYGGILIQPYDLITDFSLNYRPNLLTSIQRPKGWFAINSVWYYYSSTGNVLTGWQSVDGRWYYMDPSDDHMVTDWKLINDYWYYFNTITNEKGPKGSMLTDWQLINGKWYYFKIPSGQMQTGWLLDYGKWYYLNPNGDMVTGWLSYNGSWYYLNSSGAMVTGQYTIDGKVYYFDGSGKWIN